MSSFVEKPGWQPAAILFLFLGVHLYRIGDGPTRLHAWRETDTATVAKNFAFENGDFMHPRVDMRGTGSGIVGMELPIYSYTLGLAFRYLGYHHVWGRLLSVMAGLLLLFAFHRLLLAWEYDEKTALLAVFLASVSPLLSFFARKIHPTHGR